MEYKELMLPCQDRNSLLPHPFMVKIFKHREKMKDLQSDCPLLSRIYPCLYVAINPPYFPMCFIFVFFSCHFLLILIHIL